MSASCVLPDAVKAKAATAYRRRRAGWLTDPLSAEQDSLSVALHPPSEQQVHADYDAVVAWVRAWQRYDGPGKVEWQTRRWSSYGAQDVPVRLVLSGAGEIADAAGQARAWRAAVGRRQRLLDGYDSPALPAAVAATVSRWEALPDSDFERLLAALAWLTANPASGLFIRQLPVPGVDTKWITGHRGLLERLLDGVRGDRELGVRIVPRLCRVAVCDSSLLPGAPGIFATPLDELARLPLRPARTLILENQEGLHALAESAALPGTVALHGSGYAVHELAELDWVRTSEVVYWGDLDTHGFAILGRLRHHLPHARSLLMDVPTLEQWRELTVTEPDPAVAEPQLLTAAEREALALVRSGTLRLEQERIPWPWVVEALRRLGPV